MEHTFHFNNTLAETGLYLATERILGNISESPVVLCIGSDLAVGDSLGPVTGTMLQAKINDKPGYVYGTLKAPVTAKEAKYLATFLKRTHPSKRVIAVDAAVGADSDIGLIKLINKPLQPGAGANKSLPCIGDISILGIVAKKSPLSYSLFNMTRMNVVYSMAKIISNVIYDIITECCENFTKNTYQRNIL